MPATSVQVIDQAVGSVAPHAVDDIARSEVVLGVGEDVGLMTIRLQARGANGGNGMAKKRLRKIFWGGFADI